jgi:hypothetical protein
MLPRLLSKAPGSSFIWPDWSAWLGRWTAGKSQADDKTPVFSGNRQEFVYDLFMNGRVHPAPRRTRTSTISAESAISSVY